MDWQNRSTNGNDYVKRLRFIETRLIVGWAEKIYEKYMIVKRLKLSKIRMKRKEP